MPTLSQWKILSRLLLKKARDAAESAQNDDHGLEQDDINQGGQTEDDATHTDHHAPQKQEQTVNKELHRLPKSPTMMMAEKIYRSIPEENVPSASHQNGLQKISGQGLVSPMEGLEASRPVASPKSFQRFRPRSGKSLHIQDVLGEEPKGAADNPPFSPKTLQQKPPNSVCKIVGVPKSLSSFALNIQTSLKTSNMEQTNCNETAACDECKGQEQHVLKSPPRPSCLKRSDSCFIRRPDSRAKSVTFGRPFSSTQLYNDDVDNANDSDNDKKAVNTTHCLVPAMPIHKRDNQLKTDHCPTKSTELNIHDKQIVSPNSPKLKRPSSSGPTFWRAVQMVATVNKVALIRKASFPVDWSSGSTSTTFPKMGEENNLPRSPAFRVRRDSIVTRTFSVGQGLGRAVSPHSSTNQTSLASGLKVTSNARKEGESLEPFVIKDGQLVSAHLKSSRSKEIHDKTDIANRSQKVGQDKEDLNESKVGAKYFNSRMESQQDILNTRMSNATHAEIESSRGSYNDSGISQVSHQEERPSSRSGISTPTTMVSLVKAMGIGQGKGDPALSDGSGAVRRWSKVHQAIVSAEQLDSSPRESQLDRYAQSTTHIEELNATEQEELQKLGFRKSTKHKKRKKKKKGDSSAVSKSASHSTAQRELTIDLKEDPVLVKVGKKNQNVGKFTEPPQPKPNAVCFEVLGTSLSHGEVKAQVERLIRNSPGVKLVEIQFHHRALINNMKEMHNRWIITTNSIEGRNRLAGATVNFPGLQVQLRRYDDLVNTEYQQFTRMTNFAKMMTTRLGNGGK